MGNFLQRFLNLLPKKTRLIGTIVSTSGGYYIVQLKGNSGVVRCTGVGTYNVSDSVFIEGTEIKGKAPNATQIFVVEV